MRHKHGLFVSLTVCAISAAASAQTYTITALGLPPDGQGAQPFAINSRGDVGGVAYTSDATLPVIWQHHGPVQTLPTLDGTNGINRGNAVSAINDRGDAAGASQLATGQQFATLWRSGSATALMPVAAFPQGSYANDINDFDWVVGISIGPAYDNNNSSCATLWVNGTPTELPTTNFASYAAAINDIGQIVGWSSTSQTAPGPYHATLWDPHSGKTVDLGTLPGAVESNANSINDLGQIVGASLTTNQQIQHPVLWQDGTITDLGFPSGSGAVDGVATSINNRGQIVGWSVLAGPCSLCDIATLWQNGTAVDLNTLIDASDPLKGTVTLEAAEAINDRGQIAVVGFSNGETQAYLLTPVAGSGG